MCENCVNCMVVGGPCRNPGCNDVAGHPGPCPRVYSYNPGDPMLKAIEKEMNKTKKGNVKKWPEQVIEVK